MKFRLGNSLVQVGKELLAEVRPGGLDEIRLYYPDAEARVQKNGDFWILQNSRELIKEYMDKSERLTEEVQEHWRSYERRTRPEPQEHSTTYIENWINVHPYKTWGKPDIYPHGRAHWSTGDYESGNTVNFGDDCWLGDTFEFTHFVTPNQEGVVIRWHLGGDVRCNYSEPEVWIGDFEGFMAAQQDCEWLTEEGFLRWNEIFQGNFIWAIDQLGGFDGSWELKEETYKAIELDPTIVIGPVANKILENKRAFPPEVVMTVRKQAVHA